MPTDGQIAAIVAEYGLGDDASLTGSTARGEMGQVWQVRSGSGEFAVKHVFEAASEADVREEVEFAEAARAGGVSTPAVVRRRDGRVLLDVGGMQFRVYEWVEMDPPDISLDAAAVGSVVARVHRCGYRGQRGEDPWYSEPVGAARWDELIARLRSAGAPFADTLASMRAELLRLESLIETPVRLQTCHRDLWADNLRGTPPGEPCVIDWDNCGLADPSQELALVLFEFAYDDAERAQLLHDTYVFAGGRGRLVGRGSFSMVIAQLNHICEIGCRRWLAAAPGSPERAHNAGRVDEFTSRRLTLDVIDQLLDAVRG